MLRVIRSMRLDAVAFASSERAPFLIHRCLCRRLQARTRTKGVLGQIFYVIVQEPMRRLA